MSDKALLSLRSIVGTEECLRYGQLHSTKTRSSDSER